MSSLSLCGQVSRAVEFLQSQVLFRNKGTVEFLGQSNDMCSLSLKNEAGVYGPSSLCPSPTAIVENQLGARFGS